MNRKLLFTGFTALLFVGAAFAQIPRTPSVAGAKAYIIAPKNGAVINGPVKVVMGLSGMGVAPAGADFEGTGHHHILIDTARLADEGMPIPMDDKHRHFGKGQTETALDLPPGKHTLRLVLADKNHIPHNPPVMSEVITVTVKGAAKK